MNTFDVLLVRSKNWWERFLYGDFKDAVLIVKVHGFANHEPKCVMSLTRKGWAITEELNTFRNKNKVELLRIPFEKSQTAEERHKAFMQLLGNKGFDGVAYTQFNGIARLFGFQGWKFAGINTLMKLGEKYVGVSN